MANWASNTLTFEGDENKVKAALDFCKSLINPEDGCIEWKHLLPEELKDADMIRWGRYPGFKDNGLWYETRWSPSEWFPAYLSEQYGITIHLSAYGEPIWPWTLKADFVNGETLNVEEGEYDWWTDAFVDDRTIFQKILGKIKGKYFHIKWRIKQLLNIDDLPF